MPKPLNLTALSRTKCSECGTGCGHGMTIKATCHKSAPPWASFHPPTGSLVFTCSVCGKCIVAIAVSEADRSTMADVPNDLRMVLLHERM